MAFTRKEARLMPSIKGPMIDTTGAEYYQVQASGGRGRKVKRTWRPEPGWSARTIKRELNKFAAQLENELASGAISTKKEADEQARLAALEAAKLKTLRQYVEGVYMPTKEATFSKNARSSYQQFLNKHPRFGGQALQHFEWHFPNGFSG